MRIAASINLSAEEHKKFTKLLHSRKTSVRLLERIQIILLAHEGKDNQTIANELSVGKNKVGRWRNRYIDGGFKALEKNLPRGKNHAGKSSLGQLRLQNKVIRMTTQEKPTDGTHWTTRSLAKALNTTDTFVHRVWKSVGLKPHLVKTFKVSNDPLFEEKLHDVVGLYLDPPENAVVFCVDEKTSIQALDRTHPGLPIKKGRAETMIHDYKRHGTSTLFAALEVQTGQVIGQCKKRHRHQEFLSFLKEVERQTKSDKALHLIVVNYATHKHEKVKNWLKRNKRVELHFIPTSSSWLNLVERFFGIITEKQIRRGIFSSETELEENIMQFIASHNESPKPFVWTRTGEEILEKVKRARDKLNNPQFIRSTTLDAESLLSSGGAVREPRRRWSPVECSEDGMYLRIHDREFHFCGLTHRRIIQILYEAWELGEPRLRTASVLEEAESRSRTMSQAFSGYRENWKDSIGYGGYFYKHRIEIEWSEGYGKYYNDQQQIIYKSSTQIRTELPRACEN